MRRKCRFLLLIFTLGLALSAAAAEQEAVPEPVFSSGVLLDLPAVSMFGLANTCIPRASVLPHVVLGYHDVDVQLSLTRLYYRDGWKEGPFYTAFSMAVMPAPEFGWYHPRIGIGVWITALPRSSPEDEWEISPGDAPETNTDFFQSYYLRASPFRFGMDVGPLSLDISLLDFSYGPVIPVTVYPGFRTVGNTVIGVNFGSIGISYNWSRR